MASSPHAPAPRRNRTQPYRFALLPLLALLLLPSGLANGDTAAVSIDGQSSSLLPPRARSTELVSVFAMRTAPQIGGAAWQYTTSGSDCGDSSRCRTTLVLSAY